MFDYGMLHWVTFFAAALLLHLSPGPDMIFILGQTIKSGRASGFAAMFGIWTGAACHALVAALGLSAVFMSSASAFLVLKWAGALYLVWLGIQAFRSKGSALLPDEQVGLIHTASAFKIFRQGLVVSLLNPKVAIFFLTFLPQFVVTGSGSTTAQLLLHGFLIILVAGIVEPPLILFANKLARGFRESTAVSRWLDRGLGCLFIGLGAKLAASQQ